jgi:hypothetical protein
MRLRMFLVANAQWSSFRPRLCLNPALITDTFRDLGWCPLRPDAGAQVSARWLATDEGCAHVVPAVPRGESGGELRYQIRGVAHPGIAPGIAPCGDDGPVFWARVCTSPCAKSAS